MKNKSLEEQIISEYLKKKISISQLSKKYQISTPTIRKIFKSNSIESKYHRKLTSLQEEGICKAYLSGKGLIDTGLEFNVSRSVIKKILIRNKIAIRDAITSHIGQEAWNKNKPWSQEIKNKLSEARKGRFTRENNPNWKGGISPKYDKRRNWKIVKIWKAQCLERDNHQCRWCLSKDRVQVNHIIPLRLIEQDNISLLADINNGISLCRQCHYKIHYKEEEFIDIFRNLIKNPVNSEKTS